MLSDEIKAIPAIAALDAAGLVLDGGEHRGQLSAGIAPERIAEACRLLKDQQGYKRLSFITAVDWFPIDPRFEVVYSIHSFERNHWLRLKCRVTGENPEIDSVIPVWQAANWYEREIFDLFGIRFRNHPDLRRILMPADWQGHPLRKDYPTMGVR